MKAPSQNIEDIENHIARYKKSAIEALKNDMFSTARYDVEQCVMLSAHLEILTEETL